MPRGTALGGTEPCWDDWVSRSDPETRNIYLARLDASLRASHPLTIAGLSDLDKARAYLGLVPLNRVENDKYLDTLSKNDINGFLQRLVDEEPIFVSLRATGFDHEPVTRFDEQVAELGVALLDTRMAGTARDGDFGAECRMPIYSLHLRQEEHPRTRFDFGKTEVVMEWHCEERLKALLRECCVENGVPRHTVVVVTGDWVNLQGIYELPVNMLSIPQMAAAYGEGHHKTLEALLEALGFSQSTDNPGNEAWLILAAMVRMAVMEQVPQ